LDRPSVAPAAAALYGSNFAAREPRCAPARLATANAPMDIRR